MLTIFNDIREDGMGAKTRTDFLNIVNLHLELSEARGDINGFVVHPGPHGNDCCNVAVRTTTDEGFYQYVEFQGDWG